MKRLANQTMKERLVDSYWHHYQRVKIRTSADSEETKRLTAALEATTGVTTTTTEDDVLAVGYDLREINFRAIRTIIIEHNLAPSENVGERIKRWLIEYKEAIRLEEQFVDYGWDAWVQDAYVSRYRLRRHGQRDDRLTNWRQYETSHQVENAKTDQPN